MIGAGGVGVSTAMRFTVDDLEPPMLPGFTAPVGELCRLPS